MSNWNDLSRDRLITEYRKYPCLWSIKDGDAKNAEKRKESLNMITAELNKYEEKQLFTQDEVRTQFKNLRDMYRRKRKKLQQQQEINQSTSVDEPGWIYFARLKFLDDIVDFGPPNESPPPPPKKKAKIARSADDASLPTPLEENGGGNAIPSSSQQPSSNSNSRQSPDQSAAAGPSSSADQQIIKKDMEDNANEGGAVQQQQAQEQQRQMKEEPKSTSIIEKTHQNQSSSAEGEHSRIEKSSSPSATLMTLASTAVAEQQSFANEEESPSNSNKMIVTPTADVLTINVQTPPEQTPPKSQSSTSVRERKSGNGSSVPFAADPVVSSSSMNSNAIGGEDEFACFGRFIAMTLRKMSTRSPISALEARKEISDVLYRAELDLLPR